jgi:Fur family ferric uptake transcriptional regulator
MPAHSLSAQWLERLQTYGYRLTSPRKAVVEIIAHSQRVLSPLDVYEQARIHYPHLGLVTVYRTIDKLEELGLIQRVHQPSGCHAFIAVSPGHRHPVICQDCGRVEFLDGDKLDKLVNPVGLEVGYQITTHWLQFFGICTECQCLSPESRKEG